MTNMMRSMLLVSVSALALLLGASRAQEAGPAPAADTAPAEPAPPESTAPPAEEAVPEEGEGLSADNNLSFPVDI